MTDFNEKIVANEQLSHYQLLTTDSLYHLDPKFSGEQLKAAIEQLLLLCKQAKVHSFDNDLHTFIKKMFAPYVLLIYNRLRQAGR